MDVKNVPKKMTTTVPILSVADVVRPKPKVLNLDLIPYNELTSYDKEIKARMAEYVSRYYMPSLEDDTAELL
jgi:hypothetical protein